MWKPSSLETFDIYMHGRLLPAFGRLKLDTIDHARVSAWFDTASAERPGAANRAFDILRAMLKTARQWGENCARGRMENMIKDHKLYTKSDRTSCHRWEANQFRLFLHTGAYWLLHQLRQAAPRKSLWRTATFETLRRAFLKIAVRVEELKSRLRIALPSAYPYQPAMIAIAGRITAQGP